MLGKRIRKRHQIIQQTSLNQLQTLPHYKSRSINVFVSVICQCVLVFIGSATVLSCKLSPYSAKFEYDMLARIMYLYDPEACGTYTAASRLSTIELSNHTYGLKLLPIKMGPAVTSAFSMLPRNTRRYIGSSIAIHAIWMIAALAFIIFSRLKRVTAYCKLIPSTFFYICVFVVIYDVSMGIVYLAHVKNSLTKGMILRNSGWISGLKVKNEDDFAMWLPMVASLLWMRGVVVLAWNIYCCKLIYKLNKTIKSEEFVSKLDISQNLPFPEFKNYRSTEPSTLYFRSSDMLPTIGREESP